VDDAGLEVEPVGAVGERQQLAEPEPGAERERDQRAGEGAPESLVLSLGGDDDRGRLLRGQDRRFLLALGGDGDADARAGIAAGELAVARTDAQGDPQSGQRLAGVLGRLLGGERVDEPLDVAAGQGRDRDSTDPGNDQQAQRCLVLPRRGRLEGLAVAAADRTVPHPAREPPGGVRDGRRPSARLRGGCGRPRRRRGLSAPLGGGERGGPEGERVLEAAERSDLVAPAAADADEVAPTPAAVAAS
jgi:hypothetical protein